MNTAERNALDIVSFLIEVQFFVILLIRLLPLKYQVELSIVTLIPGDERIFLPQRASRRPKTGGTFQKANLHTDRYFEHD